MRRPLLLGTAVLLGARLLLTIPRPGPVVIVDEIGYLTNARVLTGGVAGQMGIGPFYRGGYSLVLAPLVGLVNDPEVAYRLVLVVNAALVASLFPLLYLLLTRGFRVAPRSALWAALAAAAYPAVTVTSQAAMSENLLLPLTVVWLLAFTHLLLARDGAASIGWAAAAGLCAGALYAVHGRMVVAVGLSAALLVLLALRRRLTVPTVGVGLVALGAGLLGSRLLNDFLIEQNYNGRHFDEAGMRLSALGNLDDALTVAGNLVGHTWYLLVATLGVVLILVAADGRRGLSGLVRRNADVADLLLGLLLATAAGLVVVSALSFPDIMRSDMLVYGRYVEVIAPPLLAVGLVALSDGRIAIRPWPAVAILLSLTVAVALLRLGLDVPGGENHLNLSGLRHRIVHLPPSWLAEATLVAAAVTCLLTLLLRGLRSRPPAVVGVLVLLTLAAVVLRAGLDVPQGGNRWNAVSLPFATENFVPWSIAAAGLIAAAIGAALVVLAPRWPSAVAPALILLFVPTTAYAENYLTDHTRSVYPAGWTTPQSAIPDRPPRVVAYDLDHYDVLGPGISQWYQWFLPDTHLVLFNGSRDPPPARYLISSRSWPEEHPDQPATALWNDPGRDQTLWRLADAGLKVGGRGQIRSPSGASLAVIPGAINGYVEGLAPLGKAIRISGWAADTERVRPAQQILVFSGSHLVRAGKLGRERPDLVAKFGEPLRRAGFDLLLASSYKGYPLFFPERLRVFAVLGEHATELERLH